MISGSHNLAFSPRFRVDTSRLHSQEPPFIDRLPIELLERLISLAVKGNTGLLEVEKVYMWRRVSRKWKDVIDNCPPLWSSIHTKKGTKHVRTQLEKSKGAPIDVLIRMSSVRSQDGDWIQLLVETAHRWRSVLFIHYFKTVTEGLGSLPLMLEDLEIRITEIPNDCKLFNLVRPNLRRLYLIAVTIPHNFDPRMGLEELRLYRITERREDGMRYTLSTSKFHEFFQTNPNLRILQQYDSLAASPNDGGLQSVDLPKLEEVTTCGSQILHLFRAEHCHWVRFTVRSIRETPPLSAWTTLAHTLRRVERLTIVASDASLSIRELGGPYKVEVSLDVHAARDEDRRNLVYSMLKVILDEAEKDAQISARVELALFATRKSRSKTDPRLEVLELLQTPVSHSSSRQTRWRTPNLDKIRMLEPGLPYHHLRAFIQARSNGADISPITSVSIQRTVSDDENRKEVLDNVIGEEGGSMLLALLESILR
ncbi:hypothetical protein FRC01_014403 [Tulasnella sp. 417]|nr:hypothetical protein FRC01_014403 [Tulasnella sp. 417]